jgi:CheY-like chemotaxis protein
MLRRLIGEDIELTMSLDSGLGRIKADQGQLEQIIMNLAVNARDAMPEGGKLTLETTNTEIDEAFASRYPYPITSGPYVLFAVTDTGIGMDTGTKSHIFEPFFTTKEKGKGTGLGLATVYGIVKQSGGYIHVDSELGLGTTFKIYLPRVQEAISPQQSTITRPSTLKGVGTILLVEDEASLRTLTRHLLELCGYTVLEAKSGAEALDISRSESRHIGLLLTDIVMPGFSGRTLARQLVSERPELKVVYMSGYTGQAVGVHGMLDSGSAFLQKPFTRESLARKVQEAFEGKHVAASV